MDPFYDVYQDGLAQLELFRSTSSNSLEFNNIKTELVEIIQDLGNALEVINQSKKRSQMGNGNDTFSNIDEFELSERSNKLTSLKAEFNEIVKRANLTGLYSENPFSDNNNEQNNNNSNSVNNNDADNPESNFNALYNQQLIQQQDDIISNELTASIQNLRGQALTIGNELDYQQDLLKDVDQDLDRLNYKIVNNGIKKINRFLETNKRGGTCCIAVLIGVLVIVLVLLIIL